MKKIIWVFGCLLALTACSGAEEASVAEDMRESLMKCPKANHLQCPRTA